MIFHGYFRSSAAWRCRIAFHLKGVAPDLVAVPLKTGAQRAGAHLARQPQGLVPALDTGEAVLIQSLAICEWLDETYPDPPLLPGTATERALIRGFAQVIACDIHPLQNLRVQNWLRGPMGQDDAAVTAWLAEWIGGGLAACEALLAERARTRFAFGETPTLADLCLIPQIASARRFGVAVDGLTRLLEIDAAAAAHPAFQAALPAVQPDAEP